MSCLEKAKQILADFAKYLALEANDAVEDNQDYACDSILCIDRKFQALQKDVLGLLEEADNKLDQEKTKFETELRGIEDEKLFYKSEKEELEDRLEQIRKHFEKHPPKESVTKGFVSDLECYFELDQSWLVKARELLGVRGGETK